MTNYILKKTSDKGTGVFASRDIRKNELIFQVNLNKFTKYTPEQLEQAVRENPELNGDHANYAGCGKYVIEETPAAYMNHSCDPNCYFKMKSISKYDVCALRDIKRGEELSHDYTACSVDQFDGKETWVLDCHCGSENCRGKVTGDFFKMPKQWQVKYYQYLPPSIRRKYRNKFKFRSKN